MSSSESLLEITPAPADLRLAYGGDANQFGDLRLPKGAGPFPVVVVIHGGYWRARYGLVYMGHLCNGLTRAGFATWNIEYRRVGNEGGGWRGTFEDVVHAHQYIAEIASAHQLDLKRVIVLGHSAGGQLALWLASHDTAVKRVISLAGVVDLQKAWELHLSDDAVVGLLGGTPHEVPEHYADADPMRRAITAEQWLFHGDKDIDVPAEQSREYFEHKKAAPENVHLVELKDADHYDVINPDSDAGRAIVRRVEQLLA
jgi:acetyl esterase/lipase